MPAAQAPPDDISERQLGAVKQKLCLVTACLQDPPSYPTAAEPCSASTQPRATSHPAAAPVLSWFAMLPTNERQAFQAASPCDMVIKFVLSKNAVALVVCNSAVKHW